MSPFSLIDENAICYKESNLVLLVEMHATLFTCSLKMKVHILHFCRTKEGKKSDIFFFMHLFVKGCSFFFPLSCLYVSVGNLSEMG